MTVALAILMAAATIDARPRFACEDGQHFWHSEGGRSCPMSTEECSQAVYVCKICGVYDYGEGVDSPGQRYCQEVCREARRV